MLYHHIADSGLKCIEMCSNFIWQFDHCFRRHGTLLPRINYLNRVGVFMHFLSKLLTPIFPVIRHLWNFMECSFGVNEVPKNIRIILYIRLMSVGKSVAFKGGACIYAGGGGFRGGVQYI